MTVIDGRPERLKGMDGLEHAGLLLDKMFLPSGQDPRPGDASRDLEDKQALRALNEGATAVRVPAGYKRAFELRERALTSFAGGVTEGLTRFWSATAKGRVIVGLGAESVRETSIALLHTWGVPYLPGSALKGVASAAAHRHGSPAWKKVTAAGRQGDDHRALFGDTDQGGYVIFHDAWWEPASAGMPLDLDTMTVHHRGYYQGTQEPPADWDEPNPVSFLTSRGRFLVALSGPEAWVKAAAEWLGIGLKEEGIGAKTAAGYGRMELKPKCTELDERRDALRTLPKRLLGPQNAQQLFKEVRAAAAADAALRAEAQRALRALHDGLPGYWRDWLHRKASPEDRRFAEEMEMVPRAAPVKAPAAPPPEVRTSAPAPWEPGEAWIRRNKKNQLVFYFVQSGERKPEDRFRKDVVIAEELAAALEIASEQAPVAVEVQRDGKRIRAVRRPGTEGS